MLTDAVLSEVVFILPTPQSLHTRFRDVTHFVLSFICHNSTSIWGVNGTTRGVGELKNAFYIAWDTRGRRGVSKVCAILIESGAGAMGPSNSVPLILGRFVLCLFLSSSCPDASKAPCRPRLRDWCMSWSIYLAEMASSGISGSVGIHKPSPHLRISASPSITPPHCFTGVPAHLGIVSSIMLMQAAGFKFATPSEWHYVLFLSSNKGRHDENYSWKQKYGVILDPDIDMLLPPMQSIVLC